MKAVVAPLALFLSVGSAMFGQVADPLTNHVPFEGTDLSLTITDDFWSDGLTRDAILNDKEIVADRPLHWLLDRPTSNQWASVIFLGISNSFVFDLRTTNGFPIPKTERGKAMSVGPKSRNNFYGNRSKRYGALATDFPRIDELFSIPSNGVYVLEVRYWTWVHTKQAFILSQPIRARVIKQDTNAPPNALSSP